MQFLFETKVTVKNHFLLGLEKGSRCHLQFKMEYNLIFKNLNKIKKAV